MKTELKISINNRIYVGSNYVWEAMETIIFNKIEYLFFNKRVTWDEARIICLGRQEKLATLDLEDEANFLARESSESSLGMNTVIIVKLDNLLKNYKNYF